MFVLFRVRAKRLSRTHLYSDFFIKVFIFLLVKNKLHLFSQDTELWQTAVGIVALSWVTLAYM